MDLSPSRARHRQMARRRLEHSRRNQRLAVATRRRDIVERVLACIALSGSAVAGLDIEITESTLMHGLELSIRKLSRLREAGLGVAIDDFGTGYSSLRLLAKLPVDTPQNRQVVRAEHRRHSQRRDAGCHRGVAGVRIRHEDRGRGRRDRRPIAKIAPYEMRQSAGITV